MSGEHPNYNPYAPPAPEDEFVASSYEQYSRPAPPAHAATTPRTVNPAQQQQQAYAQQYQSQPYTNAQFNSAQYTNNAQYNNQQYSQPYSNQTSSNQTNAAQYDTAQVQTQQFAHGYDEYDSKGARTSAGAYSTESYELADNDDGNYAFFNEVDDIKRNLVQYEDNIERIEGLHKRSLAESNVESEAVIQRQLDALLSDTRGLATGLKQRIKQLESTSMRDSTKHAQAENLKHQFMTMIQKFQASEAAFRQRYRDVAARQYRIVDPEATDEQVQQYIDDEQGAQVFSQALQQSNRMGDAKAALTEVQTRHREIQKIETTLMELAQLFHDMELMVAEQDQQVTNIETNVYNAQQDIERGVDNQHVAIRKAKAWRKKKWWCVAVLVVIVLFCILFFAIYFGRK